MLCSETKRKLKKVIVIFSNMREKVKLKFTANVGGFDSLWGFIIYFPLALLIEVIGEWDLSLLVDIIGWAPRNFTFLCNYELVE